MKKLTDVQIVQGIQDYRDLPQVGGNFGPPSVQALVDFLVLGGVVDSISRASLFSRLVKLVHGGYLNNLGEDGKLQTCSLSLTEKGRELVTNGD